MVYFWKNPTRNLCSSDKKLVITVAKKVCWALHNAGEARWCQHPAIAYHCRWLATAGPQETWRRGLIINESVTGCVTRNSGKVWWWKTWRAAGSEHFTMTIYMTIYNSKCANTIGVLLHNIKILSFCCTLEKPLWLRMGKKQKKPDPFGVSGPGQSSIKAPLCWSWLQTRRSLAAQGAGWMPSVLPGAS